MIPTLLFFALTLAGQQDSEKTEKQPTAESVIARYVDAKGGEEQLLKITNYSISGKMLINGEACGTFRIYQADGRSVTLITLPDGTVVSHGTDGKIAWSISEYGTATISEGQESRDFIRHFSTLHESLSWQKNSAEIRYAGQKIIDGIKTNHLIFLAEDNRQVNRYFAADTGFLVREEQFVGQRNSFQIARISDYQRCKMGTMVARKKTLSGDVWWSAEMEYQIETADPNVANIDRHLAIPESVLKLQAEKNGK